MIKYVFFMTNQDHWFNLAKDLFDSKIARPILWLGDDVHYNKARDLFGKDVIKNLILIHKPYMIDSVDYNGEFEDFFMSENYKRSKDKCLKMMDRLDLNSTFSRLDREVYFHNVILWTLNKFSQSKPDVFITVENPHSWAQYLIYEICDFLEVPTFKFNNWMPVPLLFLENMKTNIRVNRPANYLITEYENQVEFSIKSFIYDLNTKKENFEIFYMRNQRSSRKTINKIKNFFKVDIRNYFFDIKHNIGLIVKSNYSPINPFNLGFFTRIKIRNRRKLNLRNELNKLEKSFNYESEYVYFPLHFEPERTTNPDGGDFHDQFLVLTKLRGILPEEIKIVVKEHPSQFYIANKGSLGRSPLFYKLINNIKGVCLIDKHQNSIKLILNSIFTATICGSVGIEAAVLGKKSLVFGKSWYSGCPNTINWSENLTYSDIINYKTFNDIKFIENFFIELKNNFSIPSIQNGHQRKMFSDLINDDFEISQRTNLKILMESFFKNKLYNL